MRSLSLVMSECSLSGRGQGHVSNFYIVNLKNFVTASLRYTGDIHNSTVVGLFMTHCLQLNLQLHTISLVRTCRISSFCTVAWYLARLLLTRRIARSLGDSWASCSQQRWTLAKMPNSRLESLWSGNCMQLACCIIPNSSTQSRRAGLMLVIGPACMHLKHSSCRMPRWQTPHPSVICVELLFTQRCHAS